MGIYKQIMRLVFGQISDIVRYLTKMQRTKERPAQGPDYGWVNSECFKIKVVHQRDTDRPHNNSLHDKWGIGIITRTAEPFLGCHMGLLSKSHFSKNREKHKTVLSH